MTKIAMTLVFCALWSTSALARGAPLQLEEPLKSEINTFLGFASELQTALFSQDDNKTDLSIQRMISAISQAEIHLASAEGATRHLLQVLHTIRGGLNLSREYAGDRRTETLRDVFNNVVQIATNYRLDHYRIFFCSKDRAVWLQKSFQANHPFSPDTLKHCGSAIR